MKKPQNAGVLTKTADRTGRSFVKWLLRQCFFRFFCVFRCLMMRCHAAFYWYAICYIRLICKFEREVPKG